MMFVQSLPYINHHFHSPSLINEEQNAAYEGVCFYHDTKFYRSRLANKTPKKAGYFVDFWEKDDQLKNQAFSYEDAPDITLVWIIDADKKGVFMFPKEILLQKNILQTKSQKGKMGIRVYPTWESNLNQTALKTQEWQSHYFKCLST